MILCVFVFSPQPGFRFPVFGRGVFRAAWCAAMPSGDAQCSAKTGREKRLPSSIVLGLVTPSGGLVRESSPNALNSGLGIIVICLDDTFDKDLSWKKRVYTLIYGQMNLE